MLHSSLRLIVLGDSIYLLQSPVPDQFTRFSDLMKPICTTANAACASAQLLQALSIPSRATALDSSDCV